PAARDATPPGPGYSRSASPCPYVLGTTGVLRNPSCGPLSLPVVTRSSLGVQAGATLVFTAALTTRRFVMRVKVDRDRCEGNAVCVGIGPDLSDLVDEVYGVVRWDPVQ